MVIPFVPLDLRSALERLAFVQRRLSAGLHKLDALIAQNGLRDYLDAERWLLDQHFRLERVGRRGLTMWRSTGRAAEAARLIDDALSATPELAKLLRERDG